MQPHGAIDRSRGAAVLALLVTAFLTVVAVAAGGGNPAWADPEKCTINPETGECIEVPIPPGDPGDPDPGGGVCRDRDGSEVPCSKDGLSWWGSPHWCYAAPQDPQADPPRGHEDETGLWWSCKVGPTTVEVWWVVDGNAPVRSRCCGDPVESANPVRVGGREDRAAADLSHLHLVQELDVGRGGAVAHRVCEPAR